jgi:DNA-binding LacI/PurR family transcriptional regulator
MKNSWPLHALPARPVVPADAYTREAGEAAAERLLARGDGLTAIAAANDLLALGTIRALSARRLSAAPTTFRSPAITTCRSWTWCGRR